MIKLGEERRRKREKKQTSLIPDFDANNAPPPLLTRTLKKVKCFFQLFYLNRKKKLLGRNIKKKLFKYFQILTQSLQVLTKKPHTFCLKYLCSFLGLSTFYRFSFFFTPILREAAKNIVLLMAGPLRGGGGYWTGPLRKKKFGAFFSNVPFFQRGSRGEGG